MTSSSPQWDWALDIDKFTFEWMGEGTVHFGTFFFEFACLMLIETAFSKSTFGEVSALNQ